MSKERVLLTAVVVKFLIGRDFWRMR